MSRSPTRQSYSGRCEADALSGVSAPNRQAPSGTPVSSQLGGQVGANLMIEMYSRRNASNVLPIMWTLGELDIDYVRHDIGGSLHGVNTCEHVTMNPSGSIPAMVRDNGLVLWEPNSIIRFLCRRYDQSGCLLPRSDEDHALADQWMHWYTTNLYPRYSELASSLVRPEPTVRDFGKIPDLRSAMKETLSILGYHLNKSNYLLGGCLSMVDIPFGALYFCYLNLEIDRPESTGLDTWYRRLCQRPAFVEHVMSPFGTNSGEFLRPE